MMDSYLGSGFYLVVLIEGDVPTVVGLPQFLADFVVSHETVFAGVRSTERGIAGAGPHTVVVRVLERKGPTVKGNTEDSFLGLGTALEQVVKGVFHVQEEVLALLVWPVGL
jgi:hypothetical protein